MQVKKHKLKSAMRCTLLLLGLLVGANAMMAQTETIVFMHDGQENVPATGYLRFLDAGGDLIGDNHADNWRTMYPHAPENQFYELVLTFKPTSNDKGVKITFEDVLHLNTGHTPEYLMINNDQLSFYEGTTADANNLITTLTNEGAYSLTYDQEFVIQSPGAITVKFHADWQYRNYGWRAKVEEAVLTEPTKPIIQREKCSNNVYVLPTTKGSALKYATNTGSAPTNPSWNNYSGAFSIPTTPNVYVVAKAEMTIGGELKESGVTTRQIASPITNPGKPTIERVDNTNKFVFYPNRPEGLNDTYYIIYAINQDPLDDLQHATSIGGSIQLQDGSWVQRDTITQTINQLGTIKARVHGTNCNSNYSELYEFPIDYILVPTPTINITPNVPNSTATVTLEVPNFTYPNIYYTTDGSDPRTSSTRITYCQFGNTGNVVVTPTPFSVTAGTTVKAYADRTEVGENDQYRESAVASKIYLPNGEGSQGVFGSVVLLDDREDHSWSYYSDGDQPVHCLNPADVKISYFGNGKMYTSTTATPSGTLSNATGVQVSAAETANQFIYLKTLENNDPEGEENDYSYTLIPNPFSKRPTFTSNNTTYYTGFYAWRVKSIAGGEISGKNVGDLIIAETELTFQPSAETGMEVEFEAVWARAYVFNTIANLNANNATYVADANGEHRAYERNFVVVSANVGNTANSRPATITCLNPDGTGTVARRTGGMFTCEADTKFEYINLDNNNGTIIANNHYLCFGRGISTSNTAANNVSGVGGTMNGNLDYTIRIESGTYVGLDLVRNGSGTANGTVHVNAILGCDYDRADNNNERLYMARTGSTNNNDSQDSHMYFSRNYTLGEANRRHRTLDCFVKSGSYMDMPTGTNIVEINQTFYVGHTNANSCYPGLRYITVEGGNLLSITGGKGANSSTYAETTDEVFNLRMKGGIVRGCIVGGATMNPSYGSRSVIITGGTVKGWIAGGCNGTSSGGGRTVGHANFYIGGNAVIGENGTELCGVAGGNIFGAGRGNSGHGANSDTQACSIDGSNIVVADNAVVLHDVYGGGNYGYNRGVGNIYVLGGTVKGSVFGGSNQNQTAHPEATNITMKGGIVNGSIYGGSNTTGTITGLATVTMSGGTTTNVFGGGFGTGTNMANNTIVNVSGGTINNNVYGGGEEGTVTGNTNVTISGGTVKNVYGAGKGVLGSSNVTRRTANIGGTTTVNVSGEATVSESVYGGGEAGNVKRANDPSSTQQTNSNNAIASTVAITGGTITKNVYGGGQQGYTAGHVLINMSAGTVKGSIFGGAYGDMDIVYVGGYHEVNMSGGQVMTSVYGGSENANDALNFIPKSSFDSSTLTDLVSIVNMSGGNVKYQVFASGFFGNTFGSTVAHIGQNAVLNAPTTHHNPAASFFEPALLDIDGSVWAGSDFGSFDGINFGAPTISGHSDIYVDGTGYNTHNDNTAEGDYMDIRESLYGSGTSCDAGKQGSRIIVREYGQPIENPDYGSKADDPIAEPYLRASRSLYSIQRADSVMFDNAHVHFLGQGKVNSLVTTEKYTIHEFKEGVYLGNGSSLFIDFPIDQIESFHNVKFTNSVYSATNIYTYTVTYDIVGYDGVGNTPNKIRVNNGSYINVYYVNGSSKLYGELEGFAYMMTDDNNNNCAYARPKTGGANSPGAGVNTEDGGWVSYNTQYNTLDANGTTTGTKVQMAYENHVTRTMEEYFRVWKYGGKYSYREGVITAVADGASGTYSTAECVISLPASELDDNHGTYWRIQGNGIGNTTIDWGTDVYTANGAFAETLNDVAPSATGSHWMYYDSGNETIVSNAAYDNATINSALLEISNTPNLNFGLVMIPQGSIGHGSNTEIEDENETVTVSTHDDEYLATEKWYNVDNLWKPEMLFRLTFSNDITSSATLDPIKIVFEQVDASGNVVDEVTVQLTIKTATTINKEAFIGQVYATMHGPGTGSVNDTYQARITLPLYISSAYQQGRPCTWTIAGEPEFTPAEGISGITFVNCEDEFANENTFGMTISPARNKDRVWGWETMDTIPAQDARLANGESYRPLGTTIGRKDFSFVFTLHYNGNMLADGNKLLGTLDWTLNVDNFKDDQGNEITKEILIKIEVWRLGEGNKWYIDGVNGNNLFSGNYPDAAKKTLSGILGRTKYAVGDVIYIVDKITVDKDLEWDGTEYNGIKFYRYPGGHPMLQSGKPAECYTGYDYTNNPAYLDELIYIQNGTMHMQAITLDGCNPATESWKWKDEGAEVETEHPDASVDANAPLVNIASGAILTAHEGSHFQKNVNVSTDGGAIMDEGTFNFYGGSTITDNKVSADKNGAGVYLESGAVLQLSDLVTISDNFQGETQNNVYLPHYSSWITVGTNDPNLASTYVALDENSKVGVTKTTFDDDAKTLRYYTPVVYSIKGQNILGNIVESQTGESPIAFDDLGMYDIVALNNTHLNPPTNYIYYVGTWVTAVTKNPDDNTDFGIPTWKDDVNTPQRLAWMISVINGLNGCEPNFDVDFTITADIDMNANIWVPMGTSINPYIGTLNGNGYVVKGIRSPMNGENMGMFGIVGEGANINNLIASTNFQGGNVKKMGAIVGTLAGGTLSNVEAAGTLIGIPDYTTAIGGVVGELFEGTVRNAISVAEMNGSNVMGGIAGVNSGNLYNSYSNVKMTGQNGNNIGGLVGTNNGTVENCYVIFDEATSGGNYYAFVGNNNANGKVNYCYAKDQTTDFVGEALEGNSGTLTGEGTYDVVMGRKEIGYMYYDNVVTKVGETNPYIKSAINYSNGQISTWPGLVSTLNQWVAEKNGTNGSDYATWNRPTTQGINGDLPVLEFLGSEALPLNTMTQTTGSKLLDYGAIDAQLTKYNALTTQSDMFLYRNATEVANVPTDNVVDFYINEDAVLLQADNAGDFKATVGVTFDNSDHGQHAVDNLGEALEYDWHMMSTPLQDAAFGTTYNPDATLGYGQPVDIASMVNGYFPNALPMGAGYEEGVKWDFYTYYEPQYHWINFKRSIDNHWHYDEINHTHPNIPYAEADQTNGVFTPGKGYMMAISQDSYMNSTGKLNNRNVTITLTNAEPDGIDFNKGWNLVGNPYQAYLSMAPLGALGYKAFAYNADLGVYSPFVMEASENPATLADCIHPHQAFFVYTATDGTQLVFDKTTMATTEKTDNSYFRGDKINYPLVNIFAENERGNRDMTIIEFNRPEIGGAPEIQGLRNADFHIAASLDGQGYGLLFAPEGTDRVPVRFYTNENGTFTLTWETMHGNFTSLLLVDNMTGTITDMLHADHYTFDATTDDYASRFYITFAVTDVEEYNEGDNDFAWFDGSEWVINGKGNLDVVDVLGRTIYSTRLTNDQNRVNLNNVAKGVYMLRVSEGNSTKVQKVVVR